MLGLLGVPIQALQLGPQHQGYALHRDRPQPHLPPLQFSKAQQNDQVLGSAEMHHPAVGQGRQLQRRQLGPGWVAEGDGAADQSVNKIFNSLRQF